MPRSLPEDFPADNGHSGGGPSPSLHALVREARGAARRVAAAGTTEEMDAAGRAFAKAAFSVGDDEDAPEIPDPP